ncbi:TRAP transporter small permease [Pseudogracilibacillus sp. SE30717A]|uniref:TRAP transporter small permease n=1 Tax=Pseudogracilibacillus sp. SE30717A TaxID=3098293 RepID=UPI00300E4DE0
MKKVKLVLDRILEVLMGTLLVTMVFIALWQIFTRHVLSNSASFTTEFLRYALLWLALLAAAYCFGKKAHLAIVFLKERFSGKMLFIIDLFTELTVIFFAVTVLVYGGSQGVSMAMAEMSPTLRIPIGYIYIAFPISGMFIVFYSLFNIVDLFRGTKVNEDYEVTQSTM